MAKDVVCGMQVDERTAVGTSEYRGGTYYFCSKMCKERFDREPEKYAASGEEGGKSRQDR